MLLNTIIILILVITTLALLKSILTPLTSSKEQVGCRQVDIGFNHYTTGIVAEEITASSLTTRKTYQFRCPTTRSSGWVTGVKISGVQVVFACCGKPYTTQTEVDLIDLLEY